MTATGRKIAVSRRGCIQRLRRALNKQGRKLVVDRAAREHYIVDVKRGAVVVRNVDISRLCSDLGVLKPWEVIES
jgi:hypothetical protein